MLNSRSGAISLGIDFGLLEGPLHRFRRGRFDLNELLDAVAQLDLLGYLASPDGGADLVATTAELHRRLLDSGAFNEWAGETSEQDLLAAHVIAAVIYNVRTHDYWAAQMREFIASAPRGKRAQRIDAAARWGLERLLSTDRLLDYLSEESGSASTQLVHRRKVGRTVARRFIDQRNDARAIEFAGTLGPDSGHVLLEVARVLPAESTQWATLTALLSEQRAQIIGESDSTAALYGAANAACCRQRSLALALLELAQLDATAPPCRPERLGEEPYERHVRLQIELHALAAVIHHALNQSDEALRYADTCAKLAATLATRSGHGQEDVWKLPKAAGWLLAAAEPDATRRVVLLKRAYCKYDFRGAIDARLALQVATAYLDLGAAEFAAYFLAEARERKHQQRISDHFFNEVRWERVGGLLDLARVTEPELQAATVALKRLGYLPAPAAGDRFVWIDEQWYSNRGTDNPALVEPPAKSC